MSDRKWMKLDELRQTGMRRVLEATNLIADETSGLLDESSPAFMSPVQTLGSEMAPLRVNS